MIYVQTFVLNIVLCITTLWILFKICLRRLMKQLTPKRIDELFRKLLPPGEIANQLTPVVEEIGDIIPKVIPGWIRFFGRGWYRKVTGLAEALSNKEKLKEFVEVILEETDFSNVIKNNIEKRNPGVVQLLIVKTFLPWILLTGAILGTLIGMLQVIF